METREKQNLLTMIIIVAVLAIALIVGFIIYPEIKENNKTNKTNNTQNSQSTKHSESTNTTSTNTSGTTEPTTNTSNTNTEATTSISTEYVGREEENDGKAEDTLLTKEEKAIELAKKEWGKDDKNVTYNVEQKEDNIYYVAVRQNDQVQKWYEVDTEKWTIREY